MYAIEAFLDGDWHEIHRDADEQEARGVFRELAAANPGTTMRLIHVLAIVN